MTKRVTEEELKKIIDFWCVDYSKLIGKGFKEKLKRMIENGNDSERYDREKDEGALD